MLQPKKPWEKQYQTEDTKDKKPWEMGLQSDEVKKKESSDSNYVSQISSVDSEPPIGSSATQKPLSKEKVSTKFGSLSQEDFAGISPSKEIPKKPLSTAQDLELRKLKLRKEIDTAKSKGEHREVVLAKIDEYNQVKARQNAINKKIDSDIENSIFTVDQSKIDSAIKSEENDNEVSDYLREGGKNVLNVIGGIANVVPKTINAISGNNLDLPTFEPFTKKVPFEEATKQVNEQVKEIKKQNPNFQISPEEFDKRVKETFIEQQKQNQYKDNALKVLSNADPLVQERIKGKYIDSIENLDKKSKATSVQIQTLDNKATPLREELLTIKKDIDSGKADAQTIQDYNVKLANYNQLEKDYFKLISEQEKNKNEKLTAQERLKLFTLDYNPYSKAVDDLTAPMAKMIGEGVYAMGKTADKLSELPIIGDDRDEKGQQSALLNAGKSLIESSEEVTARHPQVHFTDIDGFKNFGAWTTQTLGNVAPYIIGTAIGTTEEQMASKAFLTPSKALGAFSTTSAGNAMYEMDKEMLENPNINYNNWQYAGKVLGNVASNAIMFGNYGTMLKGSRPVFESLLKTPEANVEFQKGIKDYLSKTFDVAKGANKSGALMMGSTAINMFVDNHVLGKKHENGFDELADAYIEGSAMHGLISELPNLGAYMLEKVVPNPTKKAIQENLAKNYGLVKELENPNLNNSEKLAIKSQIDSNHKANEKLLKESSKKVEGFTQNQVKELLVIDQDKFEITKKVEEIKKGNYSKEYKESALKELKSNFESLERRRQDVFENEHNALSLLPKNEQNRLEKEAKIKIAEKQRKDVADVKFDTKEVNDIALKIHKTELKDAEVKIPTPETKSEAKVQKQTKAEKVNETIKSLNELNKEDYKKIFDAVPDDLPLSVSEEGGVNKSISELYHNSKKDGSNSKFVKIVDELLNAETKTEVQKAEQENVELNTTDKFKKSVDLFNEINETEGGSKKRALVKERKAFLEEHPTVKFVDDNIREITKQLEEKGELKKSGDCP